MITKCITRITVRLIKVAGLSFLFSYISPSGLSKECYTSPKPINESKEKFPLFSLKGSKMNRTKSLLLLNFTRCLHAVKYYPEATNFAKKNTKPYPTPTFQNSKWNTNCLPGWFGRRNIQLSASPG